MRRRRWEEVQSVGATVWLVIARAKSGDDTRTHTAFRESPGTH